MFQLLSILYFLLRLQYKVFHNKNLHARSVCSRLHPYIFLDFFETLKCRFKKKGYGEPGLQTDFPYTLANIQHNDATYLMVI
jgi:hypothetical protein